MTLTIDQLKAAFKKEESTGSRPNNYYPFWNMKEGEQAIVRFLPDADAENSMGFLVEKLMHTLTINGEKKSVPCLKMFDDDCPICKVSSAYYKAEDKANGKLYWRKKQHIVQALIVEDPIPADGDSGETHEGKIRFLAIGYQLFNIIKETFESGELDEIPYAFEGGCDFIIKKTKQGDWPTYAVGSRFARKSTDLTEDQVAFVTDNMVELGTLLPQHPGSEKVEAMLEAALTGTNYEDSEGDSKDDSSMNFKSKSTKEAETTVETSAVTETVVESSSDDDDFDDEAAAILADIRDRKNKAK